MDKISVVVPNWNGAGSIGACLDSLLSQSENPHIIVVENGSTDGSLELLKRDYPSVELIIHDRNLGFAGGVNAGISRALELDSKYVALLNNDALAAKGWLKALADFLDSNSQVGVATSKMLSASGEYLDSTGELYTIWGLPYPRGRREAITDKHDKDTKVFGASGGASLYRLKMLEEIGLFDEDFFAYYEDIDLSFRAQLAGWKIAYVPDAKVTHVIGGTSNKIRGFTTYQSFKNLPWLMWKNVPRGLLAKVFIRLSFAYSLFYLRAVIRGHGLAATKGFLVMLYKLPKKLSQRRHIQKMAKVSSKYINSIITHDLPANARGLRSLRNFWWKLLRKA